MTDQTKEQLAQENEELKAKVAELESRTAVANDNVGRSTFPNHAAPGYAPHEKEQAEQDEKDRQEEAKRLAAEAKKSENK
jgi:hypothetical protein